MSKKHEDLTVTNGIAFGVSSADDVSVIDMMISVYDRKTSVTVTKQQAMDFFGLVEPKHHDIEPLEYLGFK